MFLLSMLNLAESKLCRVEKKHPVSSFYTTSETSYAQCSYTCGWRSTQYKTVQTTCSQRNCFLEYETIEVLECCEGYYSKGSDCIAVCADGCNNGYCSAPDTCTCNEGYEMENGKCTAQCSNCDNGNCVAPNVCVCSAGFVKSNAGLCVKKCSEDCINGVCNEANECVCRDGFFFNEKLLDFGIKRNTVCTAKCDKQCLNGWCAGRNFCECLHGYELDSRNSFMCVPVCANCSAGQCTAPNKCECSEGYVLHDDHCVPKCSTTCVNGFCSDPEVCTCYDGYRSSDNSNICEPVCDKLCENGICVGVNKCQCLNGYQQIAPNICEPVCDKKYVNVLNGRCIAPNVLQCDEGFNIVQSTDQRLTCISKCHPQCINATCTASGTCDCYIGYQQTAGSSHECEPHCESPCENSLCIAPNTCECNKGFKKSATQTNVCDFFCDPEVVDCAIGNCTGVDNCECPEDYDLLKHNDGVLRCTPRCEPHCENGLCLDGKVCQCLSNYKFWNSSYCEPICEQACVNGVCTEPNFCKCNTGHYRVSNFVCEPFCDPNSIDCTNGSCIKPNTCQCYDNYKLSEIDGYQKCQPVCEYLPNNTICIAPGEHQCLDGHEPGHPEGHCVPTCEQECGNGTCSAPNVCECDSEFIFDPNNETCVSICEKYCSPEFGICQNLLCQCNEGYGNVESPFLCSPICERCSNGNCIAPGTCECFEGYTMSNESFTCELQAAAQTVSERMNWNVIYIILGISAMVLIVSAGAISYFRNKKSGKSYRCKYDSSVGKTSLTDDVSDT